MLSKMKFLIIQLLVLLITFISCKYGIFDIDYPSSVSFVFKIDEQEIKESNESKTYSYTFEDTEVNKKYATLSAYHTKDGKNVNVGGFEFEADDIEFTKIDENTIGFSFSSIRSLGSHEIKAISSVSKTFDKKFIINTTSQIKDFEISYINSNQSNLQELNNKLTYTSDNCVANIALLSNNSYIFNFSSPFSSTIPLIEAECSDDNVIKTTQIDNSHIRLDVQDCPVSSKAELKFRIKNSGLFHIVNVVVENNISINAKENTIAADKIICLSKEKERYSYTITIDAQNGKNEDVFAYFSQQENEEDISQKIPEIQKLKSINFENYYMELSLDSTKRKLEIAPLNDTADKYFYIYFFDKFGRYISRLRLIIGNYCNDIELSSTSISSQTQKSGNIKAISKPTEKENIIWYFTSSQPHSLSIPPKPMSKQEVHSLIFSPNLILENTSIKLSQTPYDCNEYFFAKTLYQDNTFYYTTYSQSATVFLVAIVENTNVWKSIPFQISADSQIVLKSPVIVQDKLVPTTYYIPGKEDEFIKDMEVKNLPDGQFYPQTSENNKYGTFTRSFYLPHNEISIIEIETSNIKTPLTITSSMQSNALFAFELLQEEERKYKIIITPLWYRKQLESKQKDNISPPSQASQEQVDDYGKTFYNYLGLGTLLLKAEKAEIKMRISIFNASQ